MDRPVDFFLVGEQKSGTTFLYHLLRSHPEVAMAAVKEPNHFCADLVRESLAFHGANPYYDFADPERYAALFPASGNRLRGEATSTYLVSREAAGRIHQHNPSARILLLLREPASFLVSLHRQYLRETTEDVEDLRRAWELSDERRSGRRLPPRVRAPRLVVYADRIRYAEHVRRYLDLFPREQVFVRLMDQLAGDEEALLRDLWAFLGLEPAAGRPGAERNQDRAPRSRLLHRWLHHPGLKAAIKRWLPASALEPLKAGLDRLLLTGPPPAGPSAELVADLRRAARPEVLALQRLVEERGLELPDVVQTWGYS